MLEEGSESREVLDQRALLDLMVTEWLYPESEEYKEIPQELSNPKKERTRSNPTFYRGRENHNSMFLHEYITENYE